MRAPHHSWPQGWEWLRGLVLSVPLALLLWWLRGADEGLRTTLAIVVLLLGLPWAVPALVLVAALSAPVYMWLHTQGPVPPVIEWLGGTVLVGAVLGAHINGALAWHWLQRAKPVPEPGLGEFLKRRQETGVQRRTDDAS